MLVFDLSERRGEIFLSFIMVKIELSDLSRTARYDQWCSPVGFFELSTTEVSSFITRTDYGLMGHMG